MYYKQKGQDMVYAVVHGQGRKQTKTFVQAKPHRIHYVAQRIAGYRVENLPDPKFGIIRPTRVPNGYKLETVGRIKTIRAQARAQRRLAAFRKRFKTEGGEQ